MTSAAIITYKRHAGVIPSWIVTIASILNQTLTVTSHEKAEVIDITEQLQRVVAQSSLRNGLCHVYVAHTTAGIFINENADPDVMLDLLRTLDRLVPWDNDYRHAEGNAAAHIKAILVGSAQTVPVEAGRLALGRWQGIYFAEFDGPRQRHLHVTLVG